MSQLNIITMIQVPLHFGCSPIDEMCLYSTQKEERIDMENNGDLGRVVLVCLLLKFCHILRTIYLVSYLVRDFHSPPPQLSSSH